MVVKMEMMVDTKRDVRILKPGEFSLLLNSTPAKDRVNLQVLLYTGMRYVEAQACQEHPEWYDQEANKIKLPPCIQRKKKQKNKDIRVIYLSFQAKMIMPFFFTSGKDITEEMKLIRKLPTRVGWDQNIKRWAIKSGIGPTGISAKTTRKTWESWILAYYGGKATIPICVAQGHTTMISIKHYASNPFSEKEIDQMKEFVFGWNGIEKKRDDE